MRVFIVALCLAAGPSDGPPSADTRSDADAPSSGGTPAPASRVSVEARYAAARAAEAALNHAEAWAAYGEVLDAEPAGPRATAARARREWLDARRDPDGKWRGARALDEVRRGVVDAAERRPAVEALWGASDVAPVVRAEAGLWLALDEPSTALPVTTELWAARATLPRSIRAQAGRAHARALAAAGDVAAAEGVEAELRAEFAVPVTGQTEVARVTRAAERAWLGRVSGVVVALYGMLVLPALVRVPAVLRAGERPLPWGALPILVLSLGGGWVADRWDSGAGRMFPAFALVFVAVHVVAALAARGADTLAPGAAATAYRAFLGVGAALVTLSGAYLVLARYDALLLAGL